MRSPRIATSIFLLSFSYLLSAQDQDVFTRVRATLAPTGQGDAAIAALTNRNFDQVDEMLSRLQPSDVRHHADLLSLRGAIAFLEGKMSVAVTVFDESARLEPLHDQDNFTFAMALVTSGANDRAREILTNLATKYPQRALYIYWLGRIDYYQRRYDDAVLKLRKAEDLDPKSARIWDSLGLAYDMQGDAERALTALQTAAALNHTQVQPSPWPPHDLGFLLLRKGKWTEAEQYLREALRFDPNFAQAHHHLGRVLEKEGQDAQAVTEYQAALSNDPASPDACYSLALLYRKLHRDHEADAMFAELKRRKAAQAADSGPIQSGP